MYDILCIASQVRQGRLMLWKLCGYADGSFCDMPCLLIFEAVNTLMIAAESVKNRSLAPVFVFCIL